MSVNPSTVRTSGSGVGIVEDRSDLGYYAYGSDSGDDSTQKLLLYLYERFGPVSSFTGTYQADRWNMNITRRPPNSSEFKDGCLGHKILTISTMHTDCLSAPFQVPSELSLLQVFLSLHTIFNCTSLSNPTTYASFFLN